MKLPVVHARLELRFLEKAAADAGIADEKRRERLHCRLLLQRIVYGEPHLPHPALAELALDHLAADPLSFHATLI